MNLLFYLANALVMPPAMFFAVTFYMYRGKEINYKKLYISLSIFTLTLIVTTLQFIFPEIIPALDRNKDALLSGELWRVITPLFIQPHGLWQCLFNGVFFIAFLPLAEHLYGRSVAILYFTTGICGQLVNYYWEKGGGGSSTALYGVMGSLFMYIVLHRKDFPKAYILIPVAGFSGATILCFFKDGHAPSLLMGGMMAMVLTIALNFSNPARNESET